MKSFDRDFSTSVYAIMSQKFLWKYDKELPKELDINLQNLMKTTMEECRERDW